MAITIGAPYVLQAPVMNYLNDQARTGTVTLVEASNISDVFFVVLLAFAGLVGLIGTVIRAVVHDLKDKGRRGPAWDSAGKHLAITAAVIATVAAVTRFGLQAASYVPWWATAGFLAVAVILPVGFYRLARKVQELEPKR